LGLETWVFPSFLAERKPRYFPSGLQRGEEELSPSAEREIGSPPAAGTIQIRLRDSSASRSCIVTV
jgi:hypothetical protein